VAGCTAPTARPPLSAATIDACLAAAAERDPGGPYLIDSGTTWSFGQIAERAAATSRRLAGLGVGAGTRVALWLPNGEPWVTCFFAVARAGATVVPVGTRLRTRDLRHILSDSRASVLVYAPHALGVDFDRMVAELRRARADGELRALRHVVSVGAGRLPGVVALESVPEGADPGGAPDPDAPVVVCYTSGTTGRPKGCVHSHRTLVRNGTVAATLTGLAAGERVACPAPFAHVFGFHMGVLQCAIAGAALVNAEPYAPDRLLDLAEAHAATVAYCVPTVAHEALAEQSRRPRRLALRRVLIAGAPVSASLRRAAIGEGGLAPELAVVYGCTEAPTISQLMPDAPEEQLMRSVGRPTPGVEVRICRAGSSEELPSGDTGEILTRGYNRMLGYVGDSEATERKHRDGWLVTGDLGCMDELGYLHFVGRADETLVVGGFNVHPRDVEFQLADLDGVREVAVIGVPDERLGEVPMAWVALEDGTALDAEALLGWARANLASYKRPRYVRVVAELPRLGSGKVARVRLTEQARRTLPALPWERLGLR